MTKKYFTTMIVLSILYILIGAVLIIWPEQSRLVLCYILGGGALIYGAYRIITFFLGKDAATGVQFGMAIGAAAVVIGLFLLFKANAVTQVLAMIVGIGVLIDSVLRIQLAFNIRRMGGRDFLPILLCALCMVVLGGLLLFNPFTVVATATIIAGVTLVIDGALTLWSYIEAHRAIKVVASTVSRVK